LKYRSVDQIGPQHLGHRVTVRRTLPEGGYSDVIGVCENADASSITVRNKKGESIVIARSEIAAARVVGSPSPKGRPSSG
jgi:ribosome maturation factor RimP